MKYRLARSGVLVPASLATWRCKPNAPAVFTPSKVLTADGVPWQKNRSGRSGIVRPRSGFIGPARRPWRGVQTPAGPWNKNYPNQPSGLTPFAEIDMSALPGLQGSPGTLLGDWFVIQDAPVDQITSISDVTAPQSPYAIQWNFQNGTQSGFSGPLTGSNSFEVVGTRAVGSGGVTLGAAVQVGDVVVVEIAGKGTSALPTNCTDQLGHTYALQKSSLASAGNTNLGVYSAMISTAGTPVITPAATSLSPVRVRGYGIRNLSSATANATASVHESSANPMVTNITTSGTFSTVVCAWANCNNAVYSNVENAMPRDADAFANCNSASGLLLDVAATTQSMGANTTGTDTDSAVVLVSFPSSASGVPSGTVLQGWAQGATESSGTEYQEIYHSIWYKFPSADWEMQTLAGKWLGYWGVGQMDPGGLPLQMFNGNWSPWTAQINAGDVNYAALAAQTNTPGMTCQGPNFPHPGGTNRNLAQAFGDAGAFVIAFQQWHQAELHMKLNSIPGVADGLFEMWIDNTLIKRHTDVQYMTSPYTHGFWGWHLDPVWGSQGVIRKTRDDFIRYGHVYISGVLK